MKAHRKAYFIKDYKIIIKLQRVAQKDVGASIARPKLRRNHFKNIKRIEDYLS